MEIICVKDYQEMSTVAANLVYEKLVAKKVKVLGLATGGTPVGFYGELIKLSKENDFSFSNIHTVNLDEYVGLAETDPNSYHHFMEETFFRYIDIPSIQTHLPKGIAEDLEEECLRYEKLIEELGGIDLQILGIGANGHIGFNEPGTSFSSTTHVVELTPSTREMNARFFTEGQEVPHQAITMGIASIMGSKKVILLASGKNKAEAMKKLIEGPIEEACPATVLQTHNNLVVIADEEALSLVSKKVIS